MPLLQVTHRCDGPVLAAASRPDHRPHRPIHRLHHVPAMHEQLPGSDPAHQPDGGRPAPSNGGMTRPTPLQSCAPGSKDRKRDVTNKQKAPDKVLIMINVSVSLSAYFLLSLNGFSITFWCIFNTWLCGCSGMFPTLLHPRAMMYCHAIVSANLLPATVSATLSHQSTSLPTAQAHQQLIQAYTVTWTTSTFAWLSTAAVGPDSQPVRAFQTLA